MPSVERQPTVSVGVFVEPGEYGFDPNKTLGAPVDGLAAGKHDQQRDAPNGKPLDELWVVAGIYQADGNVRRACDVSEYRLHPRTHRTALGVELDERHVVAADEGVQFHPVVEACRPGAVGHSVIYAVRGCKPPARIVRSRLLGVPLRYLSPPGEKPYMYERILVPTDGSDGSAHVALQAIDLAKQYDATIHSLSVISDDLLSRLDIKSRDAIEEEGRRAVERVESMAHTHGVDAVTELREGDPADTILDYADDVEADLIVAGTHGRSGVERRLIGSVAERLVRYATCPVMTVRLAETDVTVDDADHATDLASKALDRENVDATITGADRQLSVWVADAESDDTSLVVYVDPVTQRTSVVERS